jgi:predicted RecB family nuclease
LIISALIIAWPITIMRKINHTIELSASDISNHLACKYVTLLDLEVVAGMRAEPVYRDPSLAILQERGQEFELNYLDFLRRQGLQISEPGGPYTGIDRTIWAMENGFDVIYQADLGRGIWRGRADFLIKVNHPSSFGPWSYGVVDTKLAKETKGGTVLQLSLYTQLLEELQGLRPELMTVITPEAGFNGVIYRVDDFQAFFRLIQRRLLGAITPGAVNDELYPNPVPHCDICRWWGVCNKQRHDDDHLSLVAGMSGSRTIEIKNWGIETLAAYAAIPMPLEFRPSRGASETFVRLREQARVQYESR